MNPSAQALEGFVRVSIVIPVYRGATSLGTLMTEVSALTSGGAAPSGRSYRVVEVVLVHDCGPDESDRTIEALSRQYPWVRAVWLSRNSGQHAATLAGMAGATGDWVVTIDEDGQQNPADIGAMLDAALDGGCQLVYAQPLNKPPHGWLRNTASFVAKRTAGALLGDRNFAAFNSFRLVDGEIARTLAAYSGHGVYLDTALSWIVGRVGHCPVMLRKEADRPSGYSYWRLLGHFWNLVFTTGTRPLRLITFVGFLSVLLALALASLALYGRLTGAVTVEGWASLLVIVSFFSGAILMALGIIAEYLAVTMGIAMGKPLYVVTSRPTGRLPTP